MHVRICAHAQQLFFLKNKAGLGTLADTLGSAYMVRLVQQIN